MSLGIPHLTRPRPTRSPSFSSRSPWKSSNWHHIHPQDHTIVVRFRSFVSRLRPSSEFRLGKGYSAPGKEKVVHHLYDPDELAQNRAKAPDVKESFEVGREEDETMPNILLPDGILPGFNEACLDFFWVSNPSFCLYLVTHVDRLDLL